MASLRLTCSRGQFSCVNEKPEVPGSQRRQATGLCFFKILSLICSGIGSDLRHFEGGLISIWVLLSGWCDGDILAEDCNHHVVKTTSNLFWVFLLPEVTAQYVGKCCGCRLCSQSFSSSTLRNRRLSDSTHLPAHPGGHLPCPAPWSLSALPLVHLLMA